MNWGDFGAWAGIVAIVLVSNVTIWGFTHQSVSALQAKSEDLRMRVNALENATRREYEKRVLTLEQLAGEMQKQEGGLEQANDRLSARLDQLEVRHHNPSTALWRLLVLAVSDCLSDLHSRLDWHLRWLEELSDEAGLEDRDELKSFDVRLVRRLEPRLYEVDVCAQSRRRKDAAKALADATGDDRSMKRLESILGDAEELRPFVDRLAARLAEKSDIRPD